MLGTGWPPELLKRKYQSVLVGVFWSRNQRLRSRSCYTQKYWFHAVVSVEEAISYSFEKYITFWYQPEPKSNKRSASQR